MKFKQISMDLEMKLKNQEEIILQREQTIEQGKNQLQQCNTLLADLHSQQVNADQLQLAIQEQQ